MTQALIRDATRNDHAIVLQLNTAEAHWTSPLTTERLELLSDIASYFRVITIDQAVTGFLLAMDSTCGYANANFEWFQSRFGEFVYVDRIVIDTSQAGHGLGRRLYDDVAEYARQNDFGRIVCEYNAEPMNVASQAFHQRMGFVEVGCETLDGTGKLVSLQCRELAYH